MKVVVLVTCSNYRPRLFYACPVRTSMPWCDRAGQNSSSACGLTTGSWRQTTSRNASLAERRDSRKHEGDFLQRTSTFWFIKFVGYIIMYSPFASCMGVMATSLIIKADVWDLGTSPIIRQELTEPSTGRWPASRPTHEKWNQPGVLRPMLRFFEHTQPAGSRPIS